MTPNASPIFVPPLEDRSAKGSTVRIRGRQTDGEYCVCEMTTLPGEGVPLHVHDRDEEFYYILEGAYEMHVEGERFVAEAGSIVVIPKDLTHKFRNAGDVPARALMIFRPGGFDELLEDHRKAREGGSADQAQRDVINKKWGVTFLKEDS